MTNVMTAKLNALVETEDFRNTVGAMNTTEELLSYLSGEGINLTSEDLEYCAASAAEGMIEIGFMNEECELSEEALEYVAGGGLVGDGIAGIVGGGLFIGVGIAYKVLGTAAICATIGGGCIALGAILVGAGVICITAAILKKYRKR